MLAQVVPTCALVIDSTDSFDCHSLRAPRFDDGLHSEKWTRFRKCNGKTKTRKQFTSIISASRRRYFGGLIVKTCSGSLLCNSAIPLPHRMSDNKRRNIWPIVREGRLAYPTNKQPEHDEFLVS